MSLAPDDPRHGTVTGYQRHGCRCDECRMAATAYVKQYRGHGLPPTDPRHGTPNAYMNYGCRCRGCTEAMADYQRERRQRRKAS